MNGIEFIAFALFLFWIFGLVSILFDLDHLWKLYGHTAPVNLTEWDGRPLHTPAVGFIVSGVCSVVFLAFIYGLVGSIYENFRTEIWLLILIGLNVATYLVAWRMGIKLNKRLGNEQ